jgi:hypothetical protein
VSAFGGSEPFIEGAQSTFEDAHEFFEDAHPYERLRRCSHKVLYPSKMLIVSAFEDAHKKP